MEPEQYLDFEAYTTAELPTVGYNVTQYGETNSTLNTAKCKWNSLNTGMTCLLILTLILNVLSSIVLFRVPLVTIRGRSNPVYFCIRFLNICDVLQAFFLILMPAFATPECGWLGGQTSCGIMGFIVLFFLLVSPLVTILMAFDRVVALYRPFKYRSHLGLKMLKVLLPSACVIVCIITILPIFGVGSYHVVKGRRFCLLDTITDNSVDRSYVIAVHAIFLLALLFMLSCTIAFQLKLVRMSFTKKHKESKSKTRKKISSRRTRNATLTTMAICCIFILCYLPYVTRVLVEASTLKKSPALITWITFGLAFLQPLLNPVVYIGTNARYRKELQALIKNMKVSDWETSSESGTTHAGSRGGFSGFRRRFSSGGNRNSKRGSKRAHHGSHTSLNNSATSPCQSHFLGKEVEKRASWKRLSKTPTFIPDDCFNKARKASTPKTQIRTPRDDQQFPSSSSGVRSCDSVEKMFLTPPALASSLTFKFSSRVIDSTTYGRADRAEAHSQPELRERSNTVSGGDKLESIVDIGKENALKQGQCSSTPALAVKDSRIQPHENHDCISIHSYDHSPRNFPSTPVKLHHSGSPKALLNPADLSPKVILLQRACKSVEGSRDSFLSASHADGTSSCADSLLDIDSGTRLRQDSRLFRPSYKKAREMTPHYFLSRKPSKRDSGVGDS